MNNIIELKSMYFKIKKALSDYEVIKFMFIIFIKIVFKFAIFVSSQLN